jgi:hypothetical protein
MAEKVCDNCGAVFVPREAKVRFCSPDCNREWWVRRRSQAMALLAQAEQATQTEEAQA